MINKLFKTYNKTSREEEYKIDPSKFYFDIDDFVKHNEELPDYLNMFNEKTMDPKLDYHMMTECYLMASEEVLGTMVIKRDRIVFKTKSELNQGNIEALKKMDEELFEKEIEKIEAQ